VLLAGGSSRAMLASARSLVLLQSTAAILAAAMFVGIVRSGFNFTSWRGGCGSGHTKSLSSS